MILDQASRLFSFGQIVGKGKARLTWALPFSMVLDLGGLLLVRLGLAPDKPFSTSFPTLGYFGDGLWFSDFLTFLLKIPILTSDLGTVTDSFLVCPL